MDIGSVPSTPFRGCIFLPTDPLATRSQTPSDVRGQSTDPAQKATDLALPKPAVPIAVLHPQIIMGGNLGALMFVSGPVQMNNVFDVSSYDVNALATVSSMQTFFNSTLSKFENGTANFNDLADLTQMVDDFQTMRAAFTDLTADLNGNANFNAAQSNYLYTDLWLDDQHVSAWWSQSRRAYLHAYLYGTTQNLPSDETLDTDALNAMTSISDANANVSVGLQTHYSDNWFIKAQSENKIRPHWLWSSAFYNGHVTEGYHTLASEYQLNINEITQDQADVNYTLKTSDITTNYDYDRWDLLLRLGQQQPHWQLWLNFREAWLKGSVETSGSDRTWVKYLDASQNTDDSNDDGNSASIDRAVETPYVFAAADYQRWGIQGALAGMAQVDFYSDQPTIDGRVAGQLLSPTWTPLPNMPPLFVYANGMISSTNDDYFQEAIDWAAHVGIHLGDHGSRTQMLQHFKSAAEIDARPIHDDAKTPDQKILDELTYYEGFDLQFNFKDLTVKAKLASQHGYMAFDYGYHSNTSALGMELGLRDWLNPWHGKNSRFGSNAFMRVEYQSAFHFKNIQDIADSGGVEFGFNLHYF